MQFLNLKNKYGVIFIIVLMLSITGLANSAIPTTEGEYYDFPKEDFIKIDKKLKPIVEQDYVQMMSVELLKSFEGFKGKSYRCPGGVVSIGYGFNKRKFKQKRLSKAAAIKHLNDKVHEIRKYIAAVTTVDLTYGQEIALISFVYNVGIPKFESSRVLKRINSNNFTGAAKDFKRWSFVKSKKGHAHTIKGLVSRRNIEKKIFLAGYDTLHVTIIKHI